MCVTRTIHLNLIPKKLYLIMTTERDSIGLVHWTSERFNQDREGLCSLNHFYEDNDPRIRQAKDVWGGSLWIVGYSDPIILTHPQKNLAAVGGEVIVLRENGSLSYLHPSAIVY